MTGDGSPRIADEWDWWPHPLPANACFGEGCELYSGYAFNRYRSTRPVGLRVGRAVGIYRWTLFELGPDAEVDIGDYTSLVGPTICVNSRLVIGSHALIADEVVIADRAAAVPYWAGCGPSARPEHRSIFIGSNVWVGQRVTILGGACIGDDAVIGAGAVIDGHVPAGAVVAGHPASVVRTTVGTGRS
jgi:acetyltransferase-like isoleucine patch superfamily enzyme